MGAWQPASPAAIAAYTSMIESLAPVQPRKMFGYPCVFVAGYLAIGTHEAGIVMRLPEDARASFVAEFSATIFTPRPGQVMREYVVVPPALYGEHATLAAWASRSIAYVASLPPKTPKVQKTRKAKEQPNARAVSRPREKTKPP